LKWIIAGAAVTALAVGSVGAQTPPSGGYLHGAAPDWVSLLAPAPQAGSQRDAADRAIFKATRALAGTPRWALAVNDVDYSVPAVLRDFSCAAGVTLDARSAPLLTALLRRLYVDSFSAMAPAKDFYHRKRPYLVDEGDICVARSKALEENYDYPSGHATLGWSVGLVMAELAPGRGGPIMERAKAFGDSRVVCGVHNASAVEAGRTLGAALVASLHGDPVFRADLDAARKEMAALRGAAPPPPRACAAERALTAATPW
jgi:acid phosphatase (class A)